MDENTLFRDQTRTNESLLAPAEADPQQERTSSVRGSAVAEALDEDSVNLGTVKKILFFWGLTVPASLGLSYCITALMLLK